MVLGYISYGLARVGEVVKHARDLDRIMGFGFNWAPPSVLVDAIGARRTIGLLEQAKLAALSPAGFAPKILQIILICTISKSVRRRSESETGR